MITLIAGNATANPASGAACGGGETNTSTGWQGDGCLSSSVKLGAPVGLALSPLPAIFTLLTLAIHQSV